MRLHYVGEGRYIHEDIPRGIPPMPPTDFETEDPIAIAVALESGLYEEAKAAKADDKEAPETPADAGDAGKPTKAAKADTA